MSLLPVTAPFDLAAPWGGVSRVVDLDGPVHYADFGGPDDAPPVVLVHGLGGSHLNWVHVAPALARRHRVVAVDLAGFGLTPGHPRSTTVHANAELLARFVREVVGGPAVLAGNSMGGMVSLLLAAREPQLVRGLVLLDPSVPTWVHRPSPEVALSFLLYATPHVGEAYVARSVRRVGDRDRVLQTVRLCFADPDRCDPDVVDAGVALTAHRRELPGVEAGYLSAARSLLRVLWSGGRYAALIRSVTAPVLLLHGEQDRLVPVAAARRVAAANPAWDAVFLPGVGHTPQLEVPEDVLGHVEPWLERLSA